MQCLSSWPGTYPGLDTSHHTMPGPQQVPTSHPAALQGSECPRVLLKLPVCARTDSVEVFQCCFKSLTEKSDCSYVLLVHSSRESFFLELGMEQTGLGGSLACALWA